MKKYLYLIKNAKIPTYIKYWLMYSSKKVRSTLQSLPLMLENTIKDTIIKITKIYGNTEQAMSETSPSPDYPSPVNNITGDVEVTIANEDNTQEQNYPISLGNIELCKIEDYQDYLYKENGNWYKYGAVGKVVLDGSENWTMGLTSRFILNVGKLSSSNTGYCDLFKTQALGKTNGITFLINTQNIYIQYNEKTNVTDFTTWLSTHNTTVYYVLATPVITQITDTTLINQLEAIQNIKAYEDITNISSDKEIKIDIDYIQRG